MTLPSVPEPFYWSHESWGAALRCRALDAVADHLFTTRQLPLSSPAASHRAGGSNDAAWGALADALGARSVVSAAQVHGAAAAIVRQGSPRFDKLPEADVLLSDDPSIAVSVRAADCVPILMADRRGGAVAAVHAGWRGTAAGAVTAALDAMAREFGSRAVDIVAAIGPSIGPCCYEVGPELVDTFAAAGYPRYLIDRWFRTPRLSAGLDTVAGDDDSGRVPSRMQRPRLRLDVAGANRDQLVLAGVPDAQIHPSGLCTAMHLDLLTSYRAEKEKAGRIAGAIRARSAGPRT